MPRLRDAASYRNYGQAPTLPVERQAELAPRMWWQAPQPLNLEDRGVDAGSPLPVRLDHGRWVVDCPDCSGAQLASESDLRFLCNYCGNAAVGGSWRRTVWPSSRDQIESAVQARPERHQSWHPTESVVDLVIENDANDVATPPKLEQALGVALTRARRR
jgi:hypothetical protein